MSLLAKVQAFIELNPGLTSNEIADAFPEYARFDVQRSASKLYRCKRVNRRLDGDVFRYYAGKDEAVILTLRQKRSGRTGYGDDYTTRYPHDKTGPGSPATHRGGCEKRAPYLRQQMGPGAPPVPSYSSVVCHVS